MIDAHIRAARIDERAALQDLIARSARRLSAPHYQSDQVEAALRGAFGVDTQLIEDGTYFVLEAAGSLWGCGGWSWRRTRFGSDSGTQRDPRPLDPARDAANIRAFFVDPAQARRGIGARLLAHCERAAAQAGFTRCTLMATLPGVAFYRAQGYVAGAGLRHDMAGGQWIELVPMEKNLPARTV